MARARFVQDVDDETCEYDEVSVYEPEEADMPSALIDQPVPTVRRVDVVQSPFLNVHYKQYQVRLTLDTGATTNMIRDSFARSITLPVKPASQMARQADGITPLDVVGEVHCHVTRGNHRFQLDALDWIV